jgi:hypothetical protein
VRRHSISSSRPELHATLAVAASLQEIAAARTMLCEIVADLRTYLPLHDSSPTPSRGSRQTRVLEESSCIDAGRGKPLC